MSKDVALDPKGPQPNAKTRNLSAEDQDDLDKLDGVFDRIKKAVPAAPYILSTPSLNPYQHYSRHEAYSFMMGHLFEPNEEHLQYRTFLYREPYKDCFALQPDEELEERPKSQASNTSSQPQQAKKKISLSAYKSKQANGVITPAGGSKKPSPNLPPTKPANALTNGVKQIDKKPVSAPQKAEARPAKRPAPEVLAPEKPEKRQRNDAPAPEPVQKSNMQEPKAVTDKSEASNATPHGLPSLLSPMQLSMDNPYDLPPILSPTLPTNIQAELDRLETQRKRAESNASTSSSDRKSQLLPVPDSRPQKAEDGAKSNSRMRSVSVNGRSPLSVSSVPGDLVAERLVIKLKYGKQKAQTVQQILRLPPKRQRVEKRERLEMPKDSSTKSYKEEPELPEKKKKPIPKVAARVSTPNALSKISSPVPAPKSAEKRPRAEDDASAEAPAKRQRALSALERPTTPSSQIISSPAMSNKSSAQRSSGPYVTPRKELKALNMLRSTSADGYDSTPGRSGVTPSNSKHLEVKPPTSAPLSSRKQADIQALSQVSQKLNAMGRSLKHEAQKILVEKGKQIKDAERKRATAISVECILSYMAAYHAQDQSTKLRGRPCEVEGTWKTLFPLCESYLARTKDFPALDGLLRYLGSVISGAICHHVSYRERARPSLSKAAHDSPQDGPQPDSAATNLQLLTKFYMRLHDLQQEARVILPMDDLQTVYPKTWKARESSNKSREPEKIRGNNLSGPYFLPIQSDTTPIQAVRFGLQLLEEFCSKEKLDYSLRVNLEKPQ